MTFKLAFRNVKRQIGNYFIYFITVSITVALMFPDISQTAKSGTKLLSSFLTKRLRRGNWRLIVLGGIPSSI